MGLINISQDTVKIYQYGSNVPIDKDDYTVSESFDNKKIIIKPVANKLEKNKIYSVVINGVTDENGNLISNTDEGNKNQYKFYFKTK
ncbi:Ig-like domain-containing protein [Clostridium felsineum]|uniref:Ig-like domain-containing protein n=1 Tax=Clostridium felsineum TaxID=36839 RepID=UPI00214D6BA6|nr:Ig-like domain-containing protein [Clostridium felsineum]MCR3760151.1 Ig-like domain-containing protein [Clostridium felsineum]